MQMTDTPNDVPLILGDLIYCLRSALDQTVWQLAKMKLGYPEMTYFPILDKNNKDTQRAFTKSITRVPARAVAIIKSLQPYHLADPTSSLLWKLHKLCNIDKHRRIPVQGQMVPLHFPKIPRRLAPHVTHDATHHLISVPLDMQHYMEFDQNISPDVTFGDTEEKIICGFATVCEMYSFVSENSIPRFQRFFRTR
jgi:hypothetical protein